MSTTVTYKGSTLTTVNNQTKTLTTQGKYLEDNITLVDATSGGGGGAFIVTLSWDSVEELWMPDKTITALQDAYDNDEEIIFACDDDSPVSWFYDDDYVFVYCVFSEGNSELLQTNYVFTTQGVEQIGVDRTIFPSFDSPSVTYTPTESQQTQTITYNPNDGYNGIEEVSVTVNAISSSYVGSGVPRKSAADMTRNKSNITAPSGYYSEAAIYNMSNCNALLTQSVDANGLVTAVYSIVTAGYQASGSVTHTTQLSSIGATTYTPSTAAQTISSQYFLTGTQTIEAIPSAYVIPTGTSSITSNGIYDITAFASVDVQVSGGGGGSHDDEDAIIARTISGTYENSRVTSIGTYAFYNCTSLTTASFPNVTSIGDSAFAYCTSLTTASFPNATSIGNSMFYNCSSLTTASFPNATSIGNSMFYNCTRLTTASFPNATSIGNSAFAYCTSLTTASFPSVTSIGAYAFVSCSSLTTASFPRVTSIMGNAFNKCRTLMSLYLLGSSVATLSNVNAFASTPISTYTTYTGGANGSIYVPASLYSTYSTATNWKTYSLRFVSV